MSGATPTQRTTLLLRERGGYCTITERWNPFAKCRTDLMGFADILWLTPMNRAVAVQCTTGENVSKRIDKILALPQAKHWLDCGNRILVIGWRKLKVKRGGKQVTWEPREVWVEVEDFVHTT